MSHRLVHVHNQKKAFHKGHLFRTTHNFSHNDLNCGMSAFLIVVTACAGYTRNAVASKIHCALTLISGAPDAWVRHGLLMDEQ